MRSDSRDQIIDLVRKLIHNKFNRSLHLYGVVRLLVKDHHLCRNLRIYLSSRLAKRILRRVLAEYLQRWQELRMRMRTQSCNSIFLKKMKQKTLMLKWREEHHLTTLTQFPNQMILTKNALRYFMGVKNLLLFIQKQEIISQHLMILL